MQELEQRKQAQQREGRHERHDGRPRDGRHDGRPQDGRDDGSPADGRDLGRANDGRRHGAPNDAMNGTMKAVSQDELGGPEVLKLVSLPTPEPGVSEILIRVHAASVNPIDGANRETGAFVGQPPFVLGWDVSGTRRGGWPRRHPVQAG